VISKKKIDDFPSGVILVVFIARTLVPGAGCQEGDQLRDHKGNNTRPPPFFLHVLTYLPGSTAGVPGFAR
jgi:hypothetical protein